MLAGVTLRRAKAREEKMATNFTVNGNAATDLVRRRRPPLLWVIREGLKLTGHQVSVAAQAGLCGRLA